MNSSLRALKLLLCTVMSDSVCRVNSPKPRDGGNTQPKYTHTHTHTLTNLKGGGRGQRDCTHTHQRGMRAAEKAKTREDTTEEPSVVGE